MLFRSICILLVNMATTVSHGVQACYDEFNGVLTQLVTLESKAAYATINTMPRTDKEDFQNSRQSLHVPFTTLLENQLGRFNLWTANTGVFAPLLLCFDYRLRDASEVRDILIDLLNSLSENLAYLKDTSIKSLGVLDLETGTTAVGETNEDAATTRKNIRDTIRYISDTIDRLHRLSNSIFRASSSSRDSRASHFVWKDKEGNDIGPTWRENFALHLCKRKFPNADPSLQ